MLHDIRDESDHEQPIRLVLIPKSKRIDYDTLMGHLFATTDLEKSQKVNLNMVTTANKPKVLDLKAILEQWNSFRLATISKRLNHRLQKITDRLHILEGLLVAYLNIDEVIRIIREYDAPRDQLMAAFGILASSKPKPYWKLSCVPWQS